MPDQTFSEELYDDAALKDAVDRMVNLIKTHATKAYVDSAVEQKQDKLTFDDAPTENSENLVNSGAVYEAVKPLKDALITESDRSSDYISNKYINLNLATGAVVDPTLVDDTVFACQIFEVSAGDTIIITGGGGNKQRLYAFMDSDYKILSKSASQYTAENEAHVAEEDGYFVSNVRMSQTYRLKQIGLTKVQNILSDLMSTDGSTWED